MQQNQADANLAQRTASCPAADMTVKTGKHVGHVDAASTLLFFDLTRPLADAIAGSVRLVDLMTPVCAGIWHACKWP